MLLRSSDTRNQSIMKVSNFLDTVQDWPIFTGSADRPERANISIDSIDQDVSGDDTGNQSIERLNHFLVSSPTDQYSKEGRRIIDVELEHLSREEGFGRRVATASLA